MPLPYNRFGIAAGYSISTVRKPSSRGLRPLLFSSSSSLDYLNGTEFTPSSTVTFGAFADLPINMSYLSVNTSLIVTNSAFSANYVGFNDAGLNYDTEVIINTTSLNLPLLFRYTLPSLGWRAFVNAGGIYSYQIENDIKVFQAALKQLFIKISELERDLIIPDHMFGLSVGLGIQRNVTYRHVLAAEIRFNHFPGSTNTLIKNQLDFTIRYSF